VTRTSHAAQCAWHCDQYEHECNCGYKRPATLLWAQSEVSSARDAVQRAGEHLAIAEARLQDMEKAAATSPPSDAEPR